MVVRMRRFLSELSRYNKWKIDESVNCRASAAVGAYSQIAVPQSRPTINRSCPRHSRFHRLAGRERPLVNSPENHPDTDQDEACTDQERKGECFPA